MEDFMVRATIQLRTDPVVKAKAGAIFKALGITLTDAVNMFLRQAINDNGFPFQPKINPKTQETSNKNTAYDTLMQFPRKKLPLDFDERKELLEALDERFSRIN
jgi:DNA-damage-inducible protein J